MSELTAVLKNINESLESTSDSIEKLQNMYLSSASVGDEDVKGKILGNVLKNQEVEKVSLLSLKNASMLAYVNSLMVLIGEKLNKEDNTAAKGRQSSIEHRVVLERGVKPLEKKLSYQLDKLTRAYTRMEKEYLEAEKRALERSESGTAANDSEADSSDEDEEMSYRPNASGVIKMAAKKPVGAGEAVDEGEEENDSSVYRPPKISAMLPPQQHHFEDKFNSQDHKDKSSRSRMQAMEEYVRDSSEQPEWEASIGTNIVNHGRGGVKSLKDTERERNLKSYEEDNFTRLHMQTSKVEKRKAKQREIMAKVNMIGGEDFSIFNSKRKLEDSTSRRGNKKSRNAWERAKKRL